MKRSLLPVLAGVFLSRAVSAASLYDQSITRVLEKRFASPAISYLLLDQQTGTIIASRWENLSQPIPVGSLVKPFTALAYGSRHSFEYPEFVCRGTSDGCWLPRGHGRMGLAQAIAFSCNSYFRQLVQGVRSEDFAQVACRFGFSARREDLPASALAGLGEEWRVLPEELARAYGELVADPAAAGVREVMRGMALSAESGTANAVGRALWGNTLLAKTGTAPCSHIPRGPGDGYVIVLFPSESSRVTLLVRVHSVPGSHAAVVGGEILRTVVLGK